MKAFLLNDFYYFRKNILINLGLFALFSFFQIISIFKGNMNIFIAFSLIFIFNFFNFRLILSSHVFDEENKFIYYIRALPMGSKEYIDTKFLSNLILSLFCWLLSFILYFAFMKDLKIFYFISLVLIIIFLVNLIIQSLVIKFGYRNVYSYIMILFVVVYIAFYLLYEYRAKEMKSFLISIDAKTIIFFMIIDIMAYFLLRRLSYKNLLKRSE